MVRKFKEKMFMVRVTEEEHREFTKFAVERHTTVSQLMRQLFHDKMREFRKNEAA